jgi:hypothetical protein
VEFVLGDVSAAAAGRRSGVGPHVRGVIDCLWQDASGEWHVLFYATDAAPGGPQEAWSSRELGMVLAAAAVEQSLGRWPATLTLYCFELGAAICRATAELPARDHLTAAGNALTGFLAQPLAGR